MKHAWHSFLDWLDRNADLIPLLAIIIVAFLLGVACLGPADPDHSQFSTLPSSPPPGLSVDAAGPGTLTPGPAATSKGQP